MKLTFISNYLTHHQIPFSDEIYKMIGKDYTFISTCPMEAGRITMGWNCECYPYELRSYRSEEEMETAKALIRDSEVVIAGSVPESMISSRLKASKLTFRYSERIFKNGRWHVFSPRAIRNIILHHTRYCKKQVYLLCAGGYVAGDYHMLGAYIGKTYRWGYFPETITYDIKTLLKGKKSNVTELLWAGRFLGWKHPELAVKLVKRLVTEGYRVHLTMIGNGEKEACLKYMAESYGISDTITFLDFMPPEKVRHYMEKSNVFLFTSDFKEGWGAVLNEAMNSGCAVVASHAIGAVPFLIKPGVNGLVFKSNDDNDLYKAAVSIISDRKRQEELGKSAYETVTELWNAKTAAARFIRLAEELMEKKTVESYTEGPCSRTSFLSNH
ncbi:glycosyltransferase [Hungatella hathewayi]|uniref:glycosyltransferase n=1 Tax=Hungatella hathewayi TaxID=154046 RepID=UPI00033D1948|nr:glycosyltransferase [Hungatella hathewayi]MCQ5385728.1 glycosyltransferase [Hungatella hathewayi]CCZ58222.1 putative uncharacterized protein [Hungatella hathewayi CAG:224]